jgi:hypothetical protein
MKTDQSIKDIVIAAIRRKGMEMDTWAHTRLWDEADPAIRAELLRECSLGTGELPILYSYINATTWSLVSTRRVWHRNGDCVGSVAAADVIASDAGNFKGYGKQESEDMVIRSKDGATHHCPFETGKPSMGMLYAVSTLCQIIPRA